MRVWGVVCDNASNNAEMMNRFKKFKMKWLTGPKVCVHCLLHVLNLASKAIAAPFLTASKESEKQPHTANPRELVGLLLLDKDEDGEVDNNNTGSVSEEYNPNEEDETGQDDSTAPSHTLDNDEEEDNDLLDVVVPELIAGSQDAKELQIAWFTHKLQFLPQFKELFCLICQEVNVPTPHNVQRNVVTQWNSTKCMIEDALRLELAILQYQKSSNFPIVKWLTRKDLAAMKTLLRLLKPLSTLTEIMSRSNVPMLADVLVHYNSLNHEYCIMALDNSIPLWAQQAANSVRLKLNKYYRITDLSSLYRLAILLHPSNQMAYLKKLEWQPQWIAQASELAADVWAQFYKPKDYEDSGDDTSSQYQFGYLLFANEVYSLLAADEDRPTDPVMDLIEGKPVIERSSSGKSKPVNPVNWWYGQRLAGEEHHGLTQMALDVLTTPASSVEVERAFSFVSHLVSKRRHSMSAYTIQSMATLGAYSCADMVPAGLLGKAYRKACEQKQANVCAKAAEAKAKAAAAEAEAIAAEQEESKEEMEEVLTKDEDVLQQSSEVKDIDLEDDD